MRIFKKILKIFGLFLAVGLVLGGLFIAHTWYFKPLNINLFFARTFLQIGLESPEYTCPVPDRPKAMRDNISGSMAITMPARASAL